MRAALFLFLLIVSGLSFTEEKCSPVVVADATKQHWVSGAPGGRTGTNYTIKLIIKTGDKVDFSNVWLGAENVPFNLELYRQEPQGNIAKGDSVLLTYNRINNETATDLKAKKLPIDYKGEALIECVIGGKARYYTVKKFRELEGLKGE